MLSLFLVLGRQSKFNMQILNEVDANGDCISSWCRQGPKQEQAFCIFCSAAINCTHHGVTAVKRHATNKRHVEICNQHRSERGILRKPATAQALLETCFLAKSAISERDRAVLAETYFVLGLALAGMPYSRGGHSNSNFPADVPGLHNGKRVSVWEKKGLLHCVRWSRAILQESGY